MTKNVVKLKTVDRRILRLHNCDTFGRDTFISADEREKVQSSLNKKKKRKVISRFLNLPTEHYTT